MVQLAGGAVVCASGWKLLVDLPKPADVTQDPAHAKLIALGAGVFLADLADDN